MAPQLWLLVALLQASFPGPALAVKGAETFRAVGLACPLDCRGQCIAGRCVPEEGGPAAEDPQRRDTPQPSANMPASMPTNLQATARRKFMLNLPKEAFFGGASAGESAVRSRFGAGTELATDAFGIDQEEAHYRPLQLLSTGSNLQLADDPARPAAAPRPVVPLPPRGPQPQEGPVLPPPGLRQYMQTQLEQEQAKETELRSENNLLRGELARWRQAGSKVAAREARVVDLIRRTGDAPTGKSAAYGHSVDASKGDEVSLLEESVNTYVFNSGRQPLPDAPNSLRLLLIYISVNALIFLCWLSAGHLKGGSYADGTFLSPALRRVGLGCYCIQVSEIQIRNVPVTGEAAVSFRVGNDQEQQTQAIKTGEGGMLLFDEVINLKVPSGGRGGLCTCSVVDSSGNCVARLEVPAWNLLRTVKKSHGEYFDFDLEVPTNRSGPAPFAAPKGRKPCLAMRLRDVTNCAEVSTAELPGRLRGRPRQMPQAASPSTGLEDEP